MLPYDVVYQVIDQLHDIHPGDVLSTVLVNRDFADASRPFLFRRMVLVLTCQDSKKGFKKQLKFFRKASHLHRHVKEIQVKTRLLVVPGVRDKHWTSFEARFGSSLEKLVVALARELGSLPLKEFIWSGDMTIPPRLLATLESGFPECELSLHHYDGYALPSSSNLSHHPLERFAHIIKRSPKLKSLELTLDPRQGRTRYNPTPAPFLQDTSCISIPCPTLNSLRLNGFHYTPSSAKQFVTCLRQWTQLRALYLDVWDSDGSEHLLHALAAAGEALPALNTFQLRIQTSREYSTDPPAHVVDVLAALPRTLQSIELFVPCPDELLDTIMDRHGPKLVSLTMHHRSSDFDYSSILHWSRVRALIRTCPSLRHLGLEANAHLSFFTGTVSELYIGREHMDIAQVRSRRHYLDLGPERAITSEDTLVDDAANIHVVRICGQNQAYLQARVHGEWLKRSGHTEERTVSVWNIDFSDNWRMAEKWTESL
ncbi:hypothetical protein PUNSTDRAFT_127805 [Punctularia strigosozonata HHB-11173 SS5]|uniref:uncharacterized protein n=1 Tax=Punctularia strigosozonata (strain HHB-11173) TaxID=741275 RepID=UPI00044177E1|nr:uncharacterized protein PUNSTDRAFT_127805 [Punctularia strigosozonata HHB-11173 SS5]EIN05921.1 hypothetical protein PUNSTDRAFT_127805 [Punctularia strigosozonata HHB-11173 SS5]